MNKRISLVAACCRSNGIGANGDLPWRLKKEMEFFSRITSTVSVDSGNSGDEIVKKNAVIMGVKTYMSIPPRYRPLKGRVNVLLSRTITEPVAGASYVFSNLSDAVSLLSSLPEIDKLFLVGGEEAYKDAVNRPEMIEYIFLTRIDADFECDRFFPTIDENVYEDLTEKPDQIEKTLEIPTEIQNENGLQYQYHLYRSKV